MQDFRIRNDAVKVEYYSFEHWSVLYCEITGPTRFWYASKLDLSPARYEFYDLAVRPVSVPGKTLLV